MDPSSSPESVPGLSETPSEARDGQSSEKQSRRRSEAKRRHVSAPAVVTKPPSRLTATMLPFFSTLFLHLLPRQVQAIHRTVGTPSDAAVQEIAIDRCGAGDPNNWLWGRCSALAECTLQQIGATTASGYNSGTNIAALVPTAMAIVGAPPMDIVRQALMSPHRGVAVAMFGIGLPVGLFRQLGVDATAWDSSDGRVREWRRPARMRLAKGLGASAGGAAWYSVRVMDSTIGAVVVDLLIMAFAGLMLWRNLVVTFETMVSWRCEWYILVFIWPMASIVWLAIALTLLYVFSRSITVSFSLDRPGARRGMLDLIAVPYRTFDVLPGDDDDDDDEQDEARKGAQTRPKNDEEFHAHPPSKQERYSSDKNKPVEQSNQSEKNNTTQNHADSMPQPGTVTKAPGQASETALHERPMFTIRIEMPFETGIRSWRFYEAIIETLAVGIYLYATFVLTSLMFLSGSEAILYACVLILSLAVVRLLSLLF
ncbi:MAG: hypothetical protein M1831_007226 [Alyxoria varia]|nr:MAG: hypothetical protein M1831_007226 [Alyxoria varia]